VRIDRVEEAHLGSGLNRDCNHNLKNLVKSAATIASGKPGPFQEFYAAMVAKGMRPEMARLTLARKIAAIGRTMRLGFQPVNLSVQAYANVKRPDTLPSPA
jgi:hypothetical protein